MNNKGVLLKRYLLFLSIIFFNSIFCSGCFEQKSLRDLAVVMGMGIDTYSDEINGQVVCITLEIADTSGSGSVNAAITGKLINCKGKSIEDAVMNMSNQLNKELFWGQLQAVVIGNEAMKLGINKNTEFLFKNQRISPMTDLIYTEGHAADILNGICGLSSITSLAMAQIMDRNKEESVKPVMPLTIQELAEKMLISDAAILIPVVGLFSSEDSSAKDMLIKFTGMAVIGQDGRIKGILRDRFALGSQLWFNAVDEFMVNASYQGESFSFKIKSWELRKVWKSDGQQGISLQIMADYHGALTDNNNKTTQNPASEYLNEACDQAIRDILTDAWNGSILLKSDYLLIGNGIRKHLPGEWRKIQDFWPQKMSEIKPQIIILSSINKEE